MTFEDKIKELNSSLEMYDNTLMKMRINGSSEDTISVIENMRGEVQNELNCLSTVLKLTKTQGRFTSEYPEPLTEGYHIDEDGYKWINFEPMLSSRFLVHIADIPDNRVVAFQPDNNARTFTVVFRESTELFIEEYMENNPSKFMNINVVVDYIDARSNVVVKKIYKDCTPEVKFARDLSYERDDLLEYVVKFRYNSFKIEKGK